MQYYEGCAKMKKYRISVVDALNCDLGGEDMERKKETRRRTQEIEV